MSVADGGKQPPVSPSLIVVPDGLVAEEGDTWAPHPALRFASSRLRRASKQWTKAPTLAPIEWYAFLLGIDQGVSRLLADVLVDEIPADARQYWLVSPFAGRLGRDRVHIMPDDAFAWDKADAIWLVETLHPLLTEDGFTLLVCDDCILAASSAPWDARPVSFAQVAGHVLPDRHPEGSDGGRLMRLCAEIQMLLATQPSERRRAAGFPDVMGVWLWAPSDLSSDRVSHPRVTSNDSLVCTCADNAEEALPVAIMNAAQIEAQIEHERLPRYWLLAGAGKAVLLDTRALPRFSRNPWRFSKPEAFAELARQLRQVSGIEGCAA